MVVPAQYESDYQRVKRFYVEYFEVEIMRLLIKASDAQHNTQFSSTHVNNKEHCRLLRIRHPFPVGTDAYFLLHLFIQTIYQNGAEWKKTFLTISQFMDSTILVPDDGISTPQDIAVKNGWVCKDCLRPSSSYQSRLLVYESCYCEMKRNGQTSLRLQYPATRNMPVRLEGLVGGAEYNGRIGLLGKLNLKKCRHPVQLLSKEYETEFQLGLDSGIQLSTLIKNLQDSSSSSSSSSSSEAKIEKIVHARPENIITTFALRFKRAPLWDETIVSEFGEEANQKRIQKEKDQQKLNKFKKKHAKNNPSMVNIGSEHFGSAASRVEHEEGKKYRCSQCAKISKKKLLTCR